jgi:hypothetical protein
LIIVVAAILCTEAAFKILHIFTDESPFHHVIHALEKELMTVGVTAFLFKVILNTVANIDESWKYALEIGGNLFASNQDLNL